MAEQALPRDGAAAITRPESADSVDQVSQAAKWQTIERDSDFQDLVRTKWNFIVPATIFFLVYYFAFLILVGYFPSVVEVKIIGNINLAYLLAISEFIMAWVLMVLYVRRAKVFDGMADRIMAKIKGGNR